MAQTKITPAHDMAQTKITPAQFIKIRDEKNALIAQLLKEIDDAKMKVKENYFPKKHRKATIDDLIEGAILYSKSYIKDSPYIFWVEVGLNEGYGYFISQDGGNYRLDDSYYIELSKPLPK